MPPLIGFDEALELGALTDHDEIGALVERAWEVRQDRFGDSTDMCSLVNAKSGGCAEDCGFCAQSRYAEADTPMHAMMEPDQILEHAKAAEAAGAHRFCMVTQGQGLSKRDFAKILEGARLVSEQTNLKRCASIGHMSADRARQLKEAGIQRVHHNVEASRSYYPEVSTTVRYEGRLRTIDAVKEAGLETCVGGILNLGESPRQRVEMAFELAEINPDSVPINLLNPRTGTKFGERELMDPWDVVKWVAIFRLILPDALFRLCGGRVENLQELAPLAVKAGLNGVMMGNFLTTLGVEPAEDREMFEELGLNVARQPDNGANPRPDNRSGWLEGETPATPIDDLIDNQADANFWDPSTQLRVIKKKGKPPAYPERPSDVGVGEPQPARRGEGWMRGCVRRTCMVRSNPFDRCQRAPRRARVERAAPPPSGDRGATGTRGGARRPAGAAALLEQLPGPGRPSAAAARGGRRGTQPRDQRGRLAADLRLDEHPCGARVQAGGVQGDRGGPAIRVGLSRQCRARSRRSRSGGRSCSRTSSTTRASSTAAGWRGRRRSSIGMPTPSISSGACDERRDAPR